MIISVIISTYNENICELHSSINSILNQTLTNFELIIVDDNPNYFNLKKYLLDIQKEDKRIKVYFNRINLGASKSRNIGIKHSNGDFIAIMDADDISKPNRLKKQLTFLRYNDLDFVFSNYQMMDINENIGSPMYNFNSIVNQSIMKYIFAYYENISLQSSWLVKREVFFKLKGYRNIIIEDYDFNIRAITYGYKLGYQNDVFLIKRKRNDSISNQNSLKQFLTLKSIQKFIKRNNYENIIPIDYINKLIASFITKNKANKFKIFLKSGHGLKYHNNIINNIITFLYSLFTSSNSLFFLYHLLMVKIRTFKINKL